MIPLERIVYHPLGRPSSPTFAQVFSVLDRPLAAYYTTPTQRREVGMVLGAFGVTLPAADPSPIFTRASNLANVCTLVLQRVDHTRIPGAPNVAAARKAQLVYLTNPEFAASVLGLAGQFGGTMGLEVAVRASLAMHFLIGILQFESGVVTIYTQAYAKSVAYYRRHEQEAQAGALRGVRLGAIEDCSKKPIWEQPGCAIANEIQKVQQGAAKVGEDVGRALQQAFNWTGDAIVAGLKWMFGEKVGGFIGALFKTFLSIIKSFVDSFGELLKAIGSAVLKTVELLLRGDFLGAAKNFFREITAALFVIPPLGPILAGLLGVSVAEVADMGRRVADRAPLFLANVASAVLGVVAPTPQAIANVVSSLRPGVAVVGGAVVVKVAGGLKGLGVVRKRRTTATTTTTSAPTPRKDVAPAVKTIAIEQAENSVDSVVSFGIGAVMGVVQAAEFANNLANSIAGSIGGVGGGEMDLVTKIEIQFKKIEIAFKEMNFKKIIDEIMGFFKGVPEVSGATLQQGPPSVSKVAAAVQSLPAGERAAAAVKTVEILSARERARLLAQTFRSWPKDQIPVLREELERAGFR